MACKITNDYVRISSRHRPGAKRTGFRGVTIHETGNTTKGANAKSHRNYYHSLANSNSGGYIGYHYFVDDKEAYLMHPLNEIAWTNGDGNGDGNMKTVSVEICVNSDGNFTKARANGAYVAATILKKYGIKKVIAVTGSNAQGNKSKANLFQHRSWMVKNCPQTIRDKGLWNSFVKTTQAELDKLWGVKKTNVVKKVVTAVKNKVTFKSYKVQVICKELNIRKTPKFVDKDIVGVVKKNDVYTIVGEKTVNGTKFGKLKSGKGYISLGSKYVKKIK